MLKSQNTTGALKVIKDEVIEKMEQLIRWMSDFGKVLNKARTVSHRLQYIERDTRETKTWAQQIAAKTQEETCLNQMAKDIEEIKAASNLSNTEIKEIKTAVHQTSKTYANAVANTSKHASNAEKCKKNSEKNTNHMKSSSPHRTKRQEKS